MCSQILSYVGLVFVLTIILVTIVKTINWFIKVHEHITTKKAELQISDISHLKEALALVGVQAYDYHDPHCYLQVSGNELWKKLEPKFEELEKKIEQKKDKTKKKK